MTRGLAGKTGELGTALLRATSEGAPTDASTAAGILEVRGRTGVGSTNVAAAVWTAGSELATSTTPGRGKLSLTRGWEADRIVDPLLLPSLA